MPSKEISVFAVTKNGRRYEDVNYISRESALKKIEQIKKLTSNGLATIPTTIKEELDCNIFLRAKNLESFSKLRDLKDNF